MFFVNNHKSNDDTYIAICFARNNNINVNSVKGTATDKNY